MPFMNRINNISFIGACIVLLLTMCMAVINMILRPLGHPITGSFELTGYGSAVAAALGLGFSQEKRYHIAVDILFKHLPGAWKRGLATLGLLASGVFFIAVSSRLFLFALDLKENGELSETLRLPFYPVVMVVSLGLFFLALNLLRDAACIVSGRVGEDRPPL